MNSGLWRRISFNVFILLVIVGGGFLGMRMLSSLAEGPQAHDEPPHAPQISVRRAVDGSHQRSLRAFGSLRPGRQFQASAEVSGRIAGDSAHWRSGQRVSEGQLLLRIDSPSLLRAQATAQAEIQRLDAEIERAQQQQQTDQALLAIEVQQAELAEALLASEEKAFATGTISQRNLDGRTQSTLAARSAKLQRQQAVNTAPMVVASLQAARSAAQAQLQESSSLLERSQIHAPFGGVISAVHYDPLQVVNPGQHLLTVLAQQAPEVHFQISSSDFLALQGDGEQSPSLTFQANGAHEKIPGQLKRVAATVDEQRRQLLLIGELNIDELSSGLAFASLGEVEIFGKEISGLRLPRSAIVDDQLWLVNEQQQLQRLSVSAQPLNADEVVVSASGILRAHSLIVIRPQRNFTEGMTVQAQVAEEAP